MHNRKVISQRQQSSTTQKIKDICRTKWTQNTDAADTFKHVYLLIADCLENVSNDGDTYWSQDSLTDARSSTGDYHHQLC